MPDPKLMQLRDAVVTVLAAIATGSGNYLTIASGSAFAGHPETPRLPALPCVGVMVSGYVAGHASYSGPTVDATAEVVVFMVARSDEDLIRLAADIQNVVTKDTSGVLLGLSFVQQVHPGDWEPRNPIDAAVPSGQVWGEYRFEVDFYHARGEA